MEDKSLSHIENVVRVVFPSTMIRDGELLPAAFKLREQEEGPEQYLSVFRQFSANFKADISAFDKDRNLPCCILNVGEVDNIKLIITTHEVKYTVMALPTPSYKSHAGIFIKIGKWEVEGGGMRAFTALNIGQEAAFHMLAIRRRLIDLAKKRIATVSLILKQQLP